ncbi:LysR family transcriptional regulator [Enterobacillus tribolii]|uniref:LysR family transcriptional regulator n=1 Tax=Enterobacillus tribolii TaxID=1487935 RepID=A0A370QU85_9GAMM|nr:LysR family transcriptional regulator [Enterobacillus tribolii]MBW7981144.1 LysR family transcriptional regulator [Enterobacillus tribolii]RDK92798.1 LysR family transcriptional regulator [Enterobacillus tribolii]
MKTTTEELLAFVSVVDSGSLTAAAELLGQTPSGVSRALGRLEQKLETTLLNRTTRRIDMTEEGRLFLERARSILEAMEEAEELLAQRRHRPAGRLRINAASPFMLHVVVPIIGEFSLCYPDIRLELNTSDQIIDLLEQRTDVAIRIGNLQDSSLHARPIGRSGLKLLAAPAYLEKHGAPQSVDELFSHCLLGFTQPATLNQWPLKQQTCASLAITPAIAASSGETLRHLALSGQGIACLSDFMTYEDRQAGRLVQVLKEEMLESYQSIHAVYYRNSQLSARIRCFLDFLAKRYPLHGD